MNNGPCAKTSVQYLYVNGILSALGRSLIRCGAWNIGDAALGESGLQPTEELGKCLWELEEEELRGILFLLAAASSRNPRTPLDPVIFTFSTQGALESRGLLKLSKILFKMQTALEV